MMPMTTPIRHLFNVGDGATPPGTIGTEGDGATPPGTIGTEGAAGSAREAVRQILGA